MKRIFDIVFSIPGLILLSPFFVILAVLIKIDSPGPVFYRQKRAGKNGYIFEIYKFRTMILDADKTGALLTLAGDSRITSVGHWIRKYKLDELPQLINVLKGEMSLVGPRPEVLKYVQLYTPQQRTVLQLVPGITDPASIRYRNENEILATLISEKVSNDSEHIYIHEIIPEKIRINLEYAANRTLWSDFKVILATIFGWKII